jgi:hypothetical protein
MKAMVGERDCLANGYGSRRHYQYIQYDEYWRRLSDFILMPHGQKVHYIQDDNLVVISSLTEGKKEYGQRSQIISTLKAGKPFRSATGKGFFFVTVH